MPARQALDDELLHAIQASRSRSLLGSSSRNTSYRLMSSDMRRPSRPPGARQQKKKKQISRSSSPSPGRPARPRSAATPPRRAPQVGRPPMVQPALQRRSAVLSSARHRGPRPALGPVSMASCFGGPHRCAGQERAYRLARLALGFLRGDGPRHFGRRLRCTVPALLVVICPASIVHQQRGLARPSPRQTHDVAGGRPSDPKSGEQDTVPPFRRKVF